MRGRRWKFKVTRPMKDRGRINNITREVKISSDMEGERLLDTVIHEALHAAYWDIEERAIEQTATDLARLLWRLGYRNLDEIKES
jgi:hypothetical protein